MIQKLGLLRKQPIAAQQRPLAKLSMNQNVSRDENEPI